MLPNGGNPSGYDFIYNNEPGAFAWSLWRHNALQPPYGRIFDSIAVPTSTYQAGNWYTVEFDVTPNDPIHGYAIIRGWVYPQGQTRPSTPLIDVMDFNPFSGGGVALGTHLVQIRYDNVVVKDHEDQYRPQIAVTPSTTSAAVTWDDFNRASPARSYLVQHKLSSSGSWMDSGYSGNLVRTHTLTSLNSSSYYDVRITATFADNSTAAETKTFYTRLPSATSEELLFSEDFEGLTVGTVNRQRNFLAAFPSNWLVTSESGNKFLRNDGDIENFADDVVLFGNSDWKNGKLLVDFRLPSASTVDWSPQLWLRIPDVIPGSEGYLFVRDNGDPSLTTNWYIYKNFGAQAGSTGPTLARDVWHSCEILTRDLGGGGVLVEGRVWPSGSSRPASPTTTWTDSSMTTFAQGFAALGANVDAVDYDNLRYYLMHEIP
jgi:hypothetical protein